MKKTLTPLIFITLAVAALMIPANAYSQKKAKTEPASDGIKLEYNFPEGKPLSFSNVTSMAQTIDFNGQSMQVNVFVLQAATVTGKGKEDGNLKLEVKIDTMSQQVESPNGSAGGLMNDAMGKSFSMKLSTWGKETDLSDAEKIAITMEGVQTNASQSFLDYFPDLPLKPVKPGDTWITYDTIKTKSSTASMTQIIKSENKYEGIEKMEGFDCAKITSTISGTRDQTSQTQGMDVATTGTFTGTSELWFAVKEGYHIKNTGRSKLTGNVEISGPQNMTMPLVADIVSVNRLKK